MKTGTKIVLGCFGLALFASLMTFLIIRANSREEEVPEEEIVSYYEEEASSSSASTAELTFPDPRNFTDEELARDDIDEPEGSDHYEVDEELPEYHVMVYNYEEIYTHYNDFKICSNLPYYLHTYFNLCTGNLDEMYEVTITEGSFKGEEYESLVTFEATVDKYPGVTIYIEYDKNYREFGIKSTLGDYSLDVLKKQGEFIEFDPDFESEEEYEEMAGDAGVEDPN